MSEIQTDISPANTLCKACGLCCTGHLFSWTKLRSAELDVVEELGVPVLRSIPSQRGFNQPCPLWDGECTIYGSPRYPHFCRKYKCSLLKKVLDETVILPDALNLIHRAKSLIQEVEAMLPESTIPSFRERFIAEVEGMGGETDFAFRRKANELISFYRNVFGVMDMVDPLPEE